MLESTQHITMNNTYNRNNPRDLLSLYDQQVKLGKEVKLREIDFIKLTEYLNEEFGLKDALEAVESGIQKYRFSSRLYTRKAELLIDKGDRDLAFDALDRAEIFGQSFVKTDILRAKAHLSKEETTEAEAILHELRFAYHLSPVQLSEVYFTEALVHKKLKSYDLMYECLKQAVQENAFNEAALQELYLTAYLANQQEDSILLHEAVLDENPYSHTAWFNLAQAHFSLGDYENALDAFEYSFIANERFEPAYKEYIEVCFLTKSYDKALLAMEEALEVLGDYDEELLLKAGQCHEYLGDTAKAKIYYYRALELNNWMDEIYFHIGECYCKEEDYFSSIHFYKQAINIDGLREDYQLSLAQAYKKLGRYQKALPHYQKATELGPELCESWITYAEFLMNLDGDEEALEVIEEAEFCTCGPELDYCKAAILFKLGRRKQALDTMADALRDGFHLQERFFDWLPDYREDKDVKGILRYFRAELEF